MRYGEREIYLLLSAGYQCVLVHKSAAELPSDLWPLNIAHREFEYDLAQAIKRKIENRTTSLLGKILSPNKAKSKAMVRRELMGKCLWQSTQNKMRFAFRQIRGRLKHQRRIVTKGKADASLVRIHVTQLRFVCVVPQHMIIL